MYSDLKSSEFQGDLNRFKCKNILTRTSMSIIMLGPSKTILLPQWMDANPNTLNTLDVDAAIINYSLAKKEKSVKPEAMLSPEDLLRPFWFDLPASFYLRVNKAAAELGMSRKELVSTAVNRFIKESKKEKRQIVLPATPVQEELIKDFQRRAGALRWKNVSADERRELMRKMAEARWGSKNASRVPEKQRPKAKSRTKS